jgi:DNA helicase-2/ATP-dependent DNA helicase PcrA
MQKYISQLNDAQQAPVLQKDGPMIIIAGAGSGKTRVLTIRRA